MASITCKTGEVFSRCWEFAQYVKKTHDTDNFVNENGVKLDFPQAWNHLGGTSKTDRIEGVDSDCTWWYDEEGNPALQLTFVDENSNAIY